jgi:RNA polymerase sigma-70 factor, ECF subfamily
MKLFSLSGEKSRAEPSLASSASAAGSIESILDSYGRFLRAAVAKVCPAELRGELHDIEQEARIRLWKALQSEKEIRNLASYVYRIAATTTIDAIRRAKALREEPLRVQEGDDEEGPMLEATGASPEMIAVQRNEAGKVREALTRLAENRRRAVSLYLQGMDFQEVGRLIGWSDAKARNLIYRGLDDLRRELRAMGIDP